MSTLTALEECFLEATIFNSKYVAVRINIGLVKEETIINPNANFAEKLKYFKRAYDEDLKHKFSGDEDIRIIAFTHGDSFKEIEEKLEWYDVTGSFSNNLN